MLTLLIDADANTICTKEAYLYSNAFDTSSAVFLVIEALHITGNVSTKSLADLVIDFTLLFVPILSVASFKTLFGVSFKIKLITSANTVSL